VAIDAAHLEYGVFCLSAIGAAVHPQRPADGSRNAAKKCKTGNRRLLRRAANLHVGHRRADANAIAGLDPDFTETTAKPDDDTWDAAIAHDQVGAETDHGNGYFTRQSAEKKRKIRFILRHEQSLRRSTHAKPGEFGKRLIREQPPAQRRHARAQTWNEIIERHATAPRVASSPGSA
jgi:hypothetical protein